MSRGRGPGRPGAGPRSAAPTAGGAARSGPPRPPATPRPRGRRRRGSADPSAPCGPARPPPRGRWQRSSSCAGVSDVDSSTTRLRKGPCPRGRPPARSRRAGETPTTSPRGPSPSTARRSRAAAVAQVRSQTDEGPPRAAMAGRRHQRARRTLHPGRADIERQGRPELAHRDLDRLHAGVDDQTARRPVARPSASSSR